MVRTNKFPLTVRTLLSFVLITWSLVSTAATYTWDQGGSDSKVTTTANWSPDGLPGVGDVVVFSNTSVNDCDIDADWSVASITLGGAYTGTVTQQAGVTITTSGALVVAAGTFAGGNSSITVGGGLTVTGGSFEANSAPCALSGALSQTGGVIDLGSSTFTISGDQFDYDAGVFTCGTSSFQIQRSAGDFTMDNAEELTFYNLSINLTNAESSKRELKILGPDNKDSLTVSNSLLLVQGQIDEGFIVVQGTMTVTTPEGGNGGLLFTGGSGSRTINLTAGTYPELILKEVGSTLAVTNGNAVTMSHLRVYNGNFTGGNSALTVTGDVTVGGAGSLTSTSGTFEVGDDFQINNGGTFSANGGLVKYSGDGTVNIRRYGSGQIDYANLEFSGAGTYIPEDTLVCTGSLTISGSGTLDLDTHNKNLKIGGNFTNTGSGNISASTETVTLNGGGAQILGGSGGTLTMHNLINANTSGDVTLGGDVQVAGTVSFRADAGEQFLLDDYDFTLTSTASITSNTSSEYFVTDGDGSLVQQGLGSGSRTGDIEFPVGPTTSKYTPLTLNNSGTADAFSVRVDDAIYEDYDPATSSLVNDAVDNTWYISEAVDGGSDVALDFQWPGSMEMAFDRSNAIVSHYNTSGSQWEQLTLPEAASGSDPYTISASGVSDFSPFGIGDDDGNVLPVELGPFRGHSEDAMVTLDWYTYTETNNDYFTVQRGLTVDDFEDIAQLSGAGNSNLKTDYSYEDGPLDPGIYYYQLRQTDFNGDEYYSDQIMIRVKTKGRTANLVLTKNPYVDGDLEAIAEGLQPGHEVLVVLYGPVGQVVYSKLEMTDNFGGLRAALDPHTKLAPGVYTVSFANNELLLNQRLVVR